MKKSQLQIENQKQTVPPGEKLKRARKQFDWTQQKCDQTVGVKPGRAYSYERGAANPTREYLAPLAKEWGIPIDWFYDGIDNMPTSVPQVPESLSLPVMGYLPALPGCVCRTGQRHPRVEFALPAGSHYRMIGDSCLAPTLIKGDHILLVPVAIPCGGVLAVVEWPDSIDVADMRRIEGALLAHPVGEDQRLPEGPGQTQFIIVEVRRQLLSGLIVTWACESGLSAPMLLFADQQ